MGDAQISTGIIVVLVIVAIFALLFCLTSVWLINKYVMAKKAPTVIKAVEVSSTGVDKDKI